MRALLDHPLLVFVLGMVLFLIAAWVGALMEKRSTEPKSEAFELVQGATLTLLGLLLGFTFAMAVSRFDSRMELAVDEASAIETSWLRAGTMPPPLDTESRAALLAYTNARLELRNAGADEQERDVASEHADALEHQIWRLAQQEAVDKRDPVSALYMSSLQNVFDLKTKRGAVYDNRIPSSAWALLLFLGVAANLLVGFSIGHRWWLLWVLPLVVAGTLMLVADLDSPVSGFIRVEPKALDQLPSLLQP
jgi:hypothetical protein